jgi:hypothetical protein
VEIIRKTRSTEDEKEWGEKEKLMEESEKVKKIMMNGVEREVIVSEVENTGTEILHLRMRLTSTALPWKRNQLLHGRPLLLAEYRTRVKPVRPAEPVFRKSTFRAWASSVCAVIFLKIQPVPFYLGRCSAWITKI